MPKEGDSTMSTRTPQRSKRMKRGETMDPRSLAALERDAARPTLALVDPTEPAKATRVVKHRYDPAVMRAKATRHTVTREPDILDEDQAVWFGDGFMVLVSTQHLDTFRTYVHAHGLAIGCDRFEVEYLTTMRVSVQQVLDTVRAS